MPSTTQHGRRRATTSISSPTLRERSGTPVPALTLRRSRSGKQLSIVAVAGVIALSALPIAQAESQRQSPAVTAEAATSATAPQHAVTADKDIAVSFSKPNISSKPASSAVPVRAVKSASSDISPLIDQISAVAPSPTAAQAPAPQQSVDRRSRGVAHGNRFCRFMRYRSICRRNWHGDGGRLEPIWGW